jgi:proprotein convertase subtilisin/kexin type 5
LVSNNSCPIDCTGANWRDYGTNECKPCHADCSSCYGANADQCLVCSDTSKVILSLPTAGACTSCAGNQYKASEGACGACHGDCGSCSGGNTASDCLSCSDSSKILASHPAKGPCTACGLNKFKSDVKTCSNCDSSCQTCQGTTLNDCLACPFGFINANHPAIGSCAACGSNQFKADEKTC